jgi:hypothetical protein
MNAGPASNSLGRVVQVARKGVGDRARRTGGSPLRPDVERSSSARRRTAARETRWRGSSLSRSDREPAGPRPHRGAAIPPTRWEVPSHLAAAGNPTAGLAWSTLDAGGGAVGDTIGSNSRIGMPAGHRSRRRSARSAPPIGNSAVPGNRRPDPNESIPRPRDRSSPGRGGRGVSDARLTRLPDPPWPQTPSPAGRVPTGLD